ncbi:AzlD domain-containing protein [Marinomonas sp. C2222]|uniref:AzlD domain-containing protein n=1 Tax=Marinomonas sargassi TaxID=2984494 RepID=A0ABT2YS41_9GAMM|nr:AzlD domain-containing protein [Marinomonas sargassi]MCV2402696.1 AzlD domain-containing protein [Marinomonas sargassi]
MDFINAVMILFGMFAVTFGVRFVLFASAHKVVMPAFFERALKFVPVAVLTSIIMPMILMPNEVLDVSFTNYWLIGGMAAFLVGILWQKQLLTIGVGIFVFFLAKYLFSL